jgi:hypothetical protein
MLGILSRLNTIQCVEYVGLMLCFIGFAHLMNTPLVCLPGFTMIALMHHDRLLPNKGILATLYYHEVGLSFILYYLILKSLMLGMLLGVSICCILNNVQILAQLTFISFFANIVLINAMLTFLMSLFVPQTLIAFLTVILSSPLLFILLTYIQYPYEYKQAYILCACWLLLIPTMMLTLPVIIGLTLESFEIKND